MPKDTTLSGFQDLIAQRRSVRAFKDDRIDRATIERICAIARKAPSGANLQPGQFHVLTGSSLETLTAELKNACESGEEIVEEYSYFPPKMSSELKDRQRKAGYALYAAAGIERRDIAGRKSQFARNYAFFGAPVGIVVTIDRDMGKGCFMDLGITLMAFLLAAEDEGLGTSGIGAIANYGPLVHSTLNLPHDQMVVCGIALGKTDEDAPINQFRTERLPLQEFTTFRGFKDS